jgi:hypothetical protein
MEGSRHDLVIEKKAFGRVLLVREREEVSKLKEEFKWLKV